MRRAEVITTGETVLIITAIVRDHILTEVQEGIPIQEVTATAEADITIAEAGTTLHATSLPYSRECITISAMCPTMPAPTISLVTIPVQAGVSPEAVESGEDTAAVAEVLEDPDWVVAVAVLVAAHTDGEDKINGPQASVQACFFFKN